MKIDKTKKYIVRSKEAGVFFGNIEEKIDTESGVEVTMTDARCLWYWDGAATLLQLASEGVTKPHNCKFTVPVSVVTVCGVCEILPCSSDAVACIEGVKPWRL